MRTVTLALALLAATPAAADDDPWLGGDKALHYGASLGLAASGYGAGALAFDGEPARLATGAGLALGAGAGKELLDLAGLGDPSWRDLAWDVAGAATGLALAWAIDRLFFQEEPAPQLRP